MPMTTTPLALHLLNGKPRSGRANDPSSAVASRRRAVRCKPMFGNVRLLIQRAM